MAYRFIDPHKIEDLLFNDAKYVTEFCEAGIKTFDEFAEDYRIHLLKRDMTNLRRAGHKVKPGAQMMGAEQIVEEYEQAKKLLEADVDEENLMASVRTMTEICSSVQKELMRLAEEQK